MAKGSFAVLLLGFPLLLIAVSCGDRAIPGQPSVAATAPPGHLAVADSSNHRVLIYNLPLTTDEAASTVLGQPDFTHNGNNQGGQYPDWKSGVTTANTLSFPTGLAMDAAGNLWVADRGNCRVLEFQPPFTTDEAASLVLGEPDMGPHTSGLNGTCWPSFTQAANGMLWPVSLAFDAVGDLWVLDALGNRATEYKPPFTNGEPAAESIGQSSVAYLYGCGGEEIPPGFYANTPAPPSAGTSLCDPEQMAFDAQGNLWITNYDSNTVMEFAPPFKTGMAATLQSGGWGSPIASCTKPSAGTGFCGPWGLAFDSFGNLWFTDVEDTRVLEFAPPFAQGMTAKLAIGDPNHVDCCPDIVNANTVDGEGSLLFDRGGDLIMSEASLNRVLVFTPPFQNNMHASIVLGQTNMNSGGQNQGPQQVYGTAPATANTLWQPEGVVTW